MNIKIGDWIRFSNGGYLYIGRVEYIRHVERLAKIYPTDVELVTSCGTVHESEVLEVRSLELSVIA